RDRGARLRPCHRLRRPRHGPRLGRRDQRVPGHRGRHRGRRRRRPGGRGRLRRGHGRVGGRTVTAETSAAASPAPLLEIGGLVAGYGGAPVLHGIDLRVPTGAVTAVLGANGAGKTTLLRTISGLLRPHAGHIRYDGHDIGRERVERIVRLGLAHVPENGGVITELTVAENLRLGGLWRADCRDAAAAVAEVYELFPSLAARARALGEQLSGGERQMLAIGRALVARPRMLLLDEPSLGLAPRITAQIMAMLRHLCDTRGLTVLIVEQNVRAALSVADDGVVMSLRRVATRSGAESLLGGDALRHAILGFGPRERKG